MVASGSTDDTASQTHQLGILGRLFPAEDLEEETRKSDDTSEGLTAFMEERKPEFSK